MRLKKSKTEHGDTQAAIFKDRQTSFLLCFQNRFFAKKRGTAMGLERDTVIYQAIKRLIIYRVDFANFKFAPV